MGRGAPDSIGPYRIVRRLGAGGMAEAFEAVRDGETGASSRVCLKRVLPAYASDPSFDALFAREARVASSLSHPNVVQVLDVGVDEGPYLVLELVDGLDLRALLATAPGRRLPVAVVTHVLVELLHALHHAHTRPAPVVHRDVTAGNVLLSRGGDVKLADFGLAKTKEGPTVTRTAAVRGTLAYLAPELLRGEAATPSTDRFALGVVAYEALVGRRPFDGAHEVETMTRLLAGRFDPVRALRPEVPDALAVVVEALLDATPARRPSDARAALAGLDALPPGDRAATGRPVLAALVEGRLGGVRTRPQVATPRSHAGPATGRHDEAIVDLDLEPSTVDPRQQAAPAPDAAATRTSPEREPSSETRPARGRRGVDVDAGREVLERTTSHPREATDPSSPRTGRTAALLVVGALVGGGVALVRALPQGLGDDAQHAAHATPRGAMRAGPARPETAHEGPAARRSDTAAPTPRSARSETRPTPTPTETARAAAVADAPRSTVAPVAAPAARPADASAHVEAVGLPAPTPVADVASVSTAPTPTSTRSPAIGSSSAPTAPTEAAPSLAPSTLRVVVVPWGNVWVDGRPLGRAPQVLELPAGVHRVAVGQETPGTAHEVRLAPGTRRVVELDLGE